MTKKNGKVAIVTGASHGIGAAVAERLAVDGFEVVVNYSGKADEAEALAHKLEGRGGRVIAVKADVSNPDAVARMFETTAATLGGTDVLVNNAGVMELSPIATTTDASIDKHLAVNLKGTFNTLRAASKHLRTGGRIINFSSSVVGLYQPTYGIYVATKAAVEALTHVLANELRGRNICVNAVAPGPTETALFMTGKSKEMVEKAANAAPLERLGQPGDIASVVAFLAGPDGAWVNGQTLRVNGGMI